MRAATPGRAIIPNFTAEDIKSASKNVMANESRPRLLGGMPTILPPAKATVNSLGWSLSLTQIFD